LSQAGSLPVSARLFIAIVSLVGVPIVVNSTLVLIHSNIPPEWVLFTILTLGSGMLTVKVPSIETRVSVSEAGAFAAVLLFGPHVGVLALALDAVRVSLHWKMKVEQTIFNFANLGLSMWVAGSVFFLVSGTRPLYLDPPPPTILLCLALMTATYFAANSGLTASIVALANRQPLRSVWMKHYRPLIPSYIAAASVSLLLVLAYREAHLMAVALILPLLGVCYLTVRSSYGRLEDTREHVAQLNRLLISTVETLATAIDAKDEVTHDHVRRVQRGTLALAAELGVKDADQLKAIEAAALLHDTGKIAVPEHILNKPGRLTPSEYEQMKKHAPIGAQILSSIEFPYPVVPIVRHHHENWDGTGYPDGIKGDAIPLGARILSVVDCFDALTSDRPYRRRMTEAQAIQILLERRGTMYDPAVVDVFVNAYSRIMPPATATPHPVAQAMGEARSHDREEDRTDAGVVVGAGYGIPDGLLAFTSLSRALDGHARLSDVGALTWLLSRHILACDAMAIFIVDEAGDRVVVRYAAGPGIARGMSSHVGTGIAGWVAATRKPAVNSDPALDLGAVVSSGARPLRSCVALPLVDRDVLVGVLAFYAQAPEAFTDDHLRLLDLVAPKLAGSLTAAAAGGGHTPDEELEMACAPAGGYRTASQKASQYH